MSRTEWTDRESSKMLAMKRKKVPLGIIANILGRTQSSIACKLQRIYSEADGRHRARIRRWSDNDIILGLEMLESGASYRKISLVLHRTRDATAVKLGIIKSDDRLFNKYKSIIEDRRLKYEHRKKLDCMPNPFIGKFFKIGCYQNPTNNFANSK